MSHCNREIFHEQWKVLLDDEFLEAYEHGLLVQCRDGITRRLYPRIFTYSADHLEKLVHSLLIVIYPNHLITAGPLLHRSEKVEHALALVVWYQNLSFRSLVRKLTRSDARPLHA